MLTLLAFHTTIPLRPWAFPATLRPKLCHVDAGLHGAGAPTLVPSTITEWRFMPRM